MKPVYNHRYGVMLGVLAVLALIATAAMAQPMPENVQGNLTISITSNGLEQSIPTPKDGGLYVVTVRNDTSASRGLVMRGIDLCCSPYIRFTKVLAPGESQTFRWFFPSDRQVELRDLLACRHALRSCTLARVGGMTTTMDFS